MKEKTLNIHKPGTFTLTGDKLETYVNMVIRLIRGSRSNKYHPDPALLSNMFEFYLPEKNFHMYDSLEINHDTGLPTEKEVTRITVDADLAVKSLKEENEQELRRAFNGSPNEVNARRLNRYFYHLALAKSPLPRLLNVRLKLRTVDTEKYIAFFNAEIDRFDLSSSLFYRYTLVIGQESPGWVKRQQVHLIDDELKYTQEFRNLISKYTVNESEFAFVLLNDLNNVTVEEIQRCQIGPLYFKGVKIPEGMEGIFRQHPDAFIMAFPSDRASMYLKEDKNNDPLVKMYRDTLDEESRRARDAKAEKIGYHVYKERKFACTKNVLSDFRKFLSAHGARCVVHGA